MELDEFDEGEIKQSRKREKKGGDKFRNMDENTRMHIKQMKLCMLEEDEVGYKEE